MMNVLLPTDFSKNAFNASVYGLKLLENRTCVFYLMHAYTPSIYRFDYVLGSPGAIGLPDDHQQLSQTRLEEIKRKLKTGFKNSRHTFVLHTAFNDLVTEVKKTVQNENIDFVIMGTQGATGAREVFFGSNTVHVLKNANVPVLTIPADYEFKAPKEILFPTDFEIDYSKTNIESLLDLADMYNANISVLHVSSPNGLSKEQKENKSNLEKLLDNVSHVFYDFPDQELIGAINEFQKEHAVDILAMVHNKHTFLERLFIEPVIRKIGLHSLVPFLVLPYNYNS